MIKTVYKKLLNENQRIAIRKGIRKGKSLFLTGSNFYCVCCNRRFRKFLGKGNGINYRLNAVCPGCGSLERTRLLFYYLQAETDIFSNNPSILHVAPEDAIRKHLKSIPDYFDIDINPNLASVKMDLTNTTFEDNKFNYIICSHVLGHIKDEVAALKEMFRILKRGGSAFVMTLLSDNESTVETDQDLAPEERLKQYGERDLERRHGTDFINRLKLSGGFDVERIDYRQNFTADEIKHFSLGDGSREILFKCTKT